MRGKFPRLFPSRVFLLVLLCASGLVLVAPTPARAQAGYEFEVPLAPVCLTGTFPVTVTADDGSVDGTAELTTSAKGTLEGTITLDGVAFTAKGKLKARETYTRVSFSAKNGKNRITFKGDLAGNAFTGTTKGKGDVAPGKGTFSLDVSGAKDAVAMVTVTFETSIKGKITGTGSVNVGGVPLDLKVSGKDGKKYRLSLKGKGFKFDGSGLPIAKGVLLAWSARGYGAKASGDGLNLPVITLPTDLVYESPKVVYEAREPVPVNIPAIGGGEVETWSIAPVLPHGLRLDANNGRIRGTPSTVTPQADYVVTASNAAGSATAKIEITIRINRADSLAPQAGPLDDADRRHFLTRTSFGVTLDSISEMEKKGLGAYVDRILTFKKDTEAERDAEIELINDSDPPGQEGMFPGETDLARWWSSIIMRTENPFQEVLALFWHDHFATSSVVLSSDRRHWMKGHVNLWRHRGNGNLRDLLVSMTRDWAMLRWLDGISNQRKAPNENFAREFWELFTLGVDNGYTQADILEAARAFTGYRERYNEATKLRFIEFDPDRHDTGDKSFFGQTIAGQNSADDYEAVVDITLEQRPAAEFICRKLFAHFVYEDPPQALIDLMAAELRTRKWDLKPVLRMLLVSEAMFSSKAKLGFVKSPVEFGIGFIRATGLVIPSSSLDRSLRDQGQRPTQPPSVDGWPTGEFWLSAQGMVERANLALTCITDRTRQEEAGVSVEDILPPEDQRSAPEVVDAMAALLKVKLSDADRFGLIDYLNTYRKWNGTTETSAFDATNAQHLDERVRGLLYILAQHPTYHIR